MILMNGLLTGISFTTNELWLLINLLVASFLGFCIGFERKLRSKEAGIRTHTIVCFGAALMMVVSKYGFGEGADSARVAAQIVAGIGFLGAGIIVYKKNEVHGLTTASGVWATAGVGMAAGAGLFILAAGAAALLIFIQWFTHRNIKIFMHKRSYTVSISFVQKTDEREKVKDLFGIDRYNSLVVERKGDVLIYHAQLNTDKEYSSTKLNSIMTDNEFILSVERHEH